MTIYAIPSKEASSQNCALSDIHAHIATGQMDVLLCTHGHLLFENAAPSNTNHSCRGNSAETIPPSQDRKPEENHNAGESHSIPIYLKLTLTAKEAAAYSNIGINKIDSMLRSPNCPFVLFIGSKKLVKRKEFEEYISGKYVL